jgi:Protein of unknown function (DUF2585)
VTSTTGMTTAKPPSPATIPWKTALLALAIIAAVALVLLSMGRMPICKCGTIKLWHGVVVSSENSQHVSDWYTFSHIIHGFIFYGAWWLFKRVTGSTWPLAVGLIAAIVVESAWEILENTDMVINRYREATIALDYFGDSVLNSVSDILAMVAGFFLAMRLPVLVTLALAVTMELFVGWLIRDNLTLNVIMLLYPLEWIKAWQTGT